MLTQLSCISQSELIKFNMEIEAYINTLKESGQRITSAKRHTVQFAIDSLIPFSARELLAHLQHVGEPVNKSTAYRQLESLVGVGILAAVNFDDGFVRYELATDSCHHHVVCESCGFTKHIEDLGKDLSRIQRKISHASGFQVNRHLVEFFGLCNRCS